MAEFALSCFLILFSDTQFTCRIGPVVTLTAEIMGLGLNKNGVSGGGNRLNATSLLGEGHLKGRTARSCLHA